MKVLLALFVLILTACEPYQKVIPPTTAPPTSTTVVRAQSGMDRATVAAVVDGDTLDVILYDGKQYRVQLIGMDTPEDYGGTDCFGTEASAFTKQNLPAGTPVLLAKDVSEIDRYRQLLRYVYLSDGSTMFNELLVREGYAQVAASPPDVKYASRFAALQGEAQKQYKGRWGGCAAPSIMPRRNTGTP